MAIGIALLFNIKLPINFNSPYKALDIQDFWRRWHITLSRFLRDYVYIPLGGNRLGSFRTYTNLLATFIIGGLWHGAGWTFIFWGFLHGMALAIHRLWQNIGFKLPKVISWFITFNFVNIAWIFFRAEEWGDAIKVLKGMFISDTFIWKELYIMQIIYMIFGIVVVVIFRNSNELLKSFRYAYLYLAFLLFLFAILQLNNFIVSGNSSEFLYFNF